jgi:aminopeptidase N
MMNQTRRSAAPAPDEAVVQPRPVNDARQARLGDQLLRLRPAEAHRVFQHAFQQHRDEQHHDKIEQQRRHHLVDAEADFQHRRAEQQQPPASAAEDGDQRQQDRRRQGNAPVPSTTVMIAPA